MWIEHRGRGPRVHESAYVAPNATICGDVTIGENGVERAATETMMPEMMRRYTRGLASHLRDHRID